MLKTANLSYKFDDKYIFSNLSFAFEDHSIFKLVGNNGTGKSTLLKILSGIYKNYEGDLTFSEDYFVFYSGHKTGLKSNLTARENIYFDIRLPKISHSHINSVLEQLDLIDYSDIQSVYLSEGQKRKINIASFMLSTANLYLLDEPFNNLDRKTTIFLQEIFDKKINEGAKIIFSSHDRSKDAFPIIDMNLFN